MSMFTIEKSFTFDAAHFLPSVPDDHHERVEKALALLETLDAPR